MGSGRAGMVRRWRSRDMAHWAVPAMARQQLVLIGTMLEEIPPDHPVWLLDEILGGVDWSAWEAHSSWFAASRRFPRGFWPRRSCMA